MKRVLVADDDAAVRELIVWKLRHAGYSTMAAADGREALAAATADDVEQRPGLVLLDWMMPELSGVEVCRAIRRHPASADIPVILLTARTDAAEVEAGLAAGADDYLLKPFSPSEMLSRVEAVLARPRVTR